MNTARIQISLIVTVFNEEKTIGKFFESLIFQTKLPNEAIIVDGGSTDNTLSVISNFQFPISNRKIRFKILRKKGNRSVGRNEAIKNARGDIIVCSDSGCILDKNWIRNIIEPFNDSKVDVVSGYYKSLPKTIFEKCLIPYVLVMPDKVNENNFLPASRSMAFRKKVWKRVGGFPEQLSNNEDYVFARNLKKISANIFFERKAIVYWIPRKNFKEAFIMFFRFALGDAESGIWRTSILMLFARYILGLYFIFLSLLYKSFIPISILLVGLVLYMLWSIKKNYKYVKDRQAIKILPLLQLTADLSVLSGSIAGLLKIIKGFNYLLYLKQNKFLFFVIFVYIGILFLILKWGVPNQNHPFPYHMDEWHQLQAVANTFRYGTPNTEGSANGTMFHFLLSGFYLIPFALLKIIDPFVLQIDNLFMRERIFMVLRLQTILFGVLSIFSLYKIADLINASKKLSIFLFTFTPIWLMLSGYFKYDVALMFWIILSILFFLRFAKNPTNRNFLIAAIPSSLAVAVKVSAIPLFIAYIISYFWFGFSRKKNIKYFFVGIVIFICIVLLFGMTDTIFWKGNILNYFYENVIKSPSSSANFILEAHPWIFLFFLHYPIIFGYGILSLFIISIFLGILLAKKEGLKESLRKYRIQGFLLFCLMVFIISLLPLKITAAGNRNLVLLPFMALIIGFTWKRISRIPKVKMLAFSVVIIAIIFQLYWSFAFLYIKMARSPQEISSEWILKHIPKNTIIGIENIPIYQYLPNIIEKEFYFNQYDVEQKNMYFYQIINDKSENLPSVIVLTNGDMENEFLNQSPKKNIIKRIKKENYRKVTIFAPDNIYIKLFVNEMNYYLSGLVASPATITIYRW